MNMKNKDKYDLRQLDIHWFYDAYCKRCGIFIVHKERFISVFVGTGNSPIPVIMEWLERESDD